MPYTIKHVGTKWKIIRKSDGKVVGTSNSRQMAIGSIAHRMDAEGK